MKIDKSIIEKLRELSVVDNCEIDENTELYYDLRLSGDDLDEFLGWVEQTWKVDFSGFIFSDYAPGEPGSLINDMARIIGKRLYKSLTLGRVLLAIKIGRWEDHQHL